MADVSKVNVNSTDYNIKDSNAMHKGVDRVTAGQSIIAPIGTASTADGYSVNASGDYSHASGYHTIASSDMQHVIGKYNEEDANDTYAFIVGGGRLDFDRKNIFTIDWNGDVNAGRSNGLTNDTKLPTGADVISYLNSNFVKSSYFAVSVFPIIATFVNGYAYKYGRVVYLTIFDGRGTSFTADQVIATIPPEYAPIYQAEFVGTYGKNRIRVTDSGNIVAVEATASTYIRGSVTYISKT